MVPVLALDVPAGPAFVDALRRAWDEGAAVLPLDPRLAPPARRAVLEALAPTHVVDAGGERHALGGGRPAEDGDAVVVATSGTTGRPKGVVLTMPAVVAAARAVHARLGVDRARDRWVACLPLAHVGGLGVVLRAVVDDVPLVALPGFDVDAVQAAAAPGPERATLVSLVATALARMDASAYRWVVLGGSAPPATLPPNATTTYGLTETGGGLVYDGAPLDGVEVRIDADGGIAVRGPMLLRGYRDGTDPRDVDGWLATGDVGAWGDDGRLVVHGRRGDLVITGGENVWPDAVEAVLRRAPGVAEVAVAGRPDPEWGQRVVAFVVPADPAAPPRLESLRDAVRAELAAFAAPKELVLVEALPRTSLGKVQRARLVAGAG
jgi:O-succinylbenzoic acid--CoA ligase